MTIGELSFEFPPSLRVTWTIPDFFRLATEEIWESGYSLRSPDFTFADCRHCLRLFQDRDLGYDFIIIELLHSIDTDPGRAVLYEVQFKSRTGEIDLYRYVNNKKVFRLCRSTLESCRGECVPDGTLTVLCSVRSREERSAESPESGGAQTRVFPQFRMTGNLSCEPYPCLYVRWRIPEFFLLPPRESECGLQSPEFPYSDRRYCLRLIRICSFVYIHLLNLSDPVPERYISYEVGLKSTTGEEIDIERWGTSTERIFRSALLDMQSVRFPDGHLTVFCWMRSREPSNGGCPKSGGAETVSSKAPVPEAAARPKSVAVQTSNEEEDKEGLPGCTVKSGELSFDSLRVTWSITDFFRLTTDSAYSLQCPDFTFGDGRYSLRLSSSGNDNEFVDIELVNSTDTVFGRYVSYEVGLKSTTGEEIDIGHFGTSTTREFCIPRDELDKKKSEYFPDGHLTVFCCMRSREPNNAGSPNSGRAESHLFPGSRAAAHPKSVAVQTSNEEQDNEALPGVDKLQYKYKYRLLAA